MKLFKRILFTIFIIVVIILSILAIYLTRQHLIVKNIRNNLAKYRESTNFYVKQITNSDEEENTLNEYYILGKKSIEKNKFNIPKDSKSYEENNKNVSTVTIFTNGDERNIYFDDNMGKSAVINEETSITYSANDFFFDIFETDNTLDYLKMLLKLKISSTDYNGKECYLIDLNNAVDMITLTKDSENVDTDNIKIYYEKDTGLMLKSNDNDEYIKEFEYKFDCVTEDDFTEPDISEYDIIQR